MKIPIEWIKEYINLEHSLKEFGNIMTSLEFMQDGSIVKVEGYNVIDLEVRQNRPDMLSIIGAAREYAAYINKQIKYPKQVEETEVEWQEPKNNLKVEAKDIVKRFCTVEIKNIEIKKSPKWMQERLEAYGIPAVNNVVDITNYVMLEYGMPLHAFDISKLKKDQSSPLLTLRRAEENDSFTTWQKTNIKLTSQDLVVADIKNPVAIAGVIGGANSDIDNKSTHILLECAVYEHATIRKTSLRHTIRTDASTRHEKFLNPHMVETAIRRALYLIKELTGGEIVKIEDYYPNRYEPVLIDFDINEITRLAGIQLEVDDVTNYLTRLGFEILEKKEALEVGQNLLVVRVPNYRTDVNIEADLVEEVLRLWGYENIETTEIVSTSPNYSTSKVIQLEEKIRDILVSLGLDEHITNPLVKSTNLERQILLENPLNEDMNALRTSIRKTLEPVVIQSAKFRNKEVSIFEVGKVYFQIKEGEYVEERRVETLYHNINFDTKVKPDFLAVLSRLGIFEKQLDKKETDIEISYFVEKTEIARLYETGYILFSENLSKIVDIKNVPEAIIQTRFTQIIEEDITLITKVDQSLSSLVNEIYKASEYIRNVYLSNTYKGDKIEKGFISITLTIEFEDAEKKLKREDIEKIKAKIISLVKLSPNTSINEG